MQNAEQRKKLTPVGVVGWRKRWEERWNSVRSKTNLEKKEEDGIINYSWRSLDFGEWNKGLVLDYRPNCRRDFYPTIFFLPFSGLINFESRD